MADVFISYKKEDRANAERFVSALQNEGFSVWWDDSLTPKASWDSEIERELSQAAAAIVLWTPLSVASDWVRTEAHFAQDRGKLVPVMLESCKIPIAFLLKQTIDLTKWKGARDDRHWRKLLTWIADLAATKPGNANIPQALSSAQANPYRDIVGKLANGESVVDGTLVNESTPAGTVFNDGQGLPPMRIVPKGGFLMGASDRDPDRSPFEGPRKRIEIPAPFAIGVYPLLGSEYARLTGAPPKPSDETTATPGALELANPAIYISFDDASVAVARLASMTGMEYRLPSEAEWEYCCRARSHGRYTFGDAIDANQAHFASDKGPVPPTRFAPNAFGLHDMHGNVREWTMDLWHDSYEQTHADGRAVLEGHGSMRVVRGGCWWDQAAQLRSSARQRATHTTRSPMIGMRVARAVV
jgi:formylglycine-generating enzyme required for sulfatase activity